MEERLFSARPVIGDEQQRRDPNGAAAGFLVHAGDLNLPTPIPDDLEVEVFQGWRLRGTNRGRILVTDVRRFHKVREGSRVAVYADDASTLPVVQDPTP